MHVSVRTRYRILILSCALLLICVLSPRNGYITISAKHVIQWSARLGKGARQAPLPLPSQTDDGRQTTQQLLPPSASEDWSKPVPVVPPRRYPPPPPGQGYRNMRHAKNMKSSADEGDKKGEAGSKIHYLYLPPAGENPGRIQRPMSGTTGTTTTTATTTASANSADDPEQAAMQRLRAVAAAAVGQPGAGSPDPLEVEFLSWRRLEYDVRPKPAYKKPKPNPESENEGSSSSSSSPVLPDPFPLLSQHHPLALDALLRPPDINRPPSPRFPLATPLLVGFTRNWPQLMQCVVSYIAAGWPPEDIYVVENTGVMRANRDGLLTLQNPFYLNWTQLDILGVNAITTPTLLTFAQLQNFYAWTALERNWTEYFWSHEDVMVFSYEDELYVDGSPPSPGSDSNAAPGPARALSLYARAVAVLEYLRKPGVPKWANHFFAYDHLTLVNRDAILDIGGWDTHIPFYGTDCDMYDRLMWAGYRQEETSIGYIFDVSTVLDDVAALLRIPGVHAAFVGDLGPDWARDEPEPEPEPEPAFLNDDDNVDESRKAAHQAVLAAWAARAEERRQVRAEALLKVAARRRHVDREGETFEHLLEVARRMEAAKYAGGGQFRNAWQGRQAGGDGEPFYRDPDGFETGLQMMVDTGRRVFAEKWGHRGCDLTLVGRSGDDAWRLERDWDEETEGEGHEGDAW